MGWLRRIVCVFSVGLALSNPLAAQQNDLDTAPAELAFGWLGSERVPNGFLYAPHVWHTMNDGNYRGNILAFSYEGWFGGTFLNTYNRQTVLVGRSADILSFGRFGATFVYGLMYGYDDLLFRTSNVPQFAKFLFKGEIHPFVALTPYYRISDRLLVGALVSPLFYSFGVMIDLDDPEKRPAKPVWGPPNLVFTVGAGAAVEPTYFGADSSVVTPKFSFDLDFLSIGKRGLGSRDPDFIRTGLSPRGSFRLVRARSASDSPELAGLRDVDLSLELGLGLSYRQPTWEVFAAARYGVLGHNGWVGEMGADYIVGPHKDVTVRVGPRLSLGDKRFTSTYFGVTAAESAASGLAAFSPKGGVYSAGVEFGVAYSVNDKWGLKGTLRYDRLLNDALNSPITRQGSAEQVTLGFMVERRFSTLFKLF